MKKIPIILLILLSACTLLKAEYPRHKVRGVPHPPRLPPSKQFAKKWHQPPAYPPQRNPIRARPIQAPMGPSHKVAMGVPSGKPQIPTRHVSHPVRNFWQNAPQVNNVKYPQEKPYMVPQNKPYLPQEKPILVAPSIKSQENDYHIQTNNIPTTHTNPIKQIGEKGPIHTIPAPNLSLRDKPIIVEEVKYQHKHNEVEQKHQYHVTEQPEPLTKNKLYRGQSQLLQQQQIIPQQFYQKQFEHQHQIQQPQQQQQQQHKQDLFLQQQLQKQIEIQPQLFYTPDTVPLSSDLNVPTQKTPQGEIYLGNQLTPNELYQLIGAAYPQQPQVQVKNVQDNFYQMQKTQQVPNYQALLTQQLFQPEQKNYEQNTQPAVNNRRASDKVVFEPELHSFNYDEQTYQANQKGLTAYSLDKKIPKLESRSSVDSLVQAQLIQNYFDTRSDVEDNDVEPDAKPSAAQETQTNGINKDLLESSYFSSLPNKEAADRLAELQAAGKINSNLMKLSTDDQQTNSSNNGEQNNSNEGSNENFSENINHSDAEYEDYSLEEETGSSQEKHDEFGDKLNTRSDKN
ncbi:hypothetical protein NQ315_005422 [Exocentrus adspersus]|uniref:Uncharacterized protein n=1 Tax=Exocentrus adspersus TaxID=1586481 RepID=A0AAV8W267_9CUCU|nr:hypothetical protein NQ315_005422 [Exocentrus adspersus]